MKNGWQIKPLQVLCDDFKQDIVDGPFGSELQRKDYIEEGIPVLKIQNIKPFAIELKKMDFVSPAKFQELKRHSYRRGDIVMTKLGSPLGVSAIVEDLDEGVIVADLVRIRARRINTKYLCYHLNSQRTNDFINSMQKGTTRPRVTLSVVRELPIAVPSAEEQQRIVGILDEAFDGLATAKANAEQNLHNARALFESHLQSVFTRRGEGWVDKRLEEICERVSVGHVGPTSEFYCGQSDGIPFLRSQNVRRGHLDWDGIQYVTKEFHQKLRKSQLLAGDLLFVRVGANRGDCCSVPTDVGEINCANIVFARPIKGNVAYLEYYCESAQGRQQLLGMTTGAAQGVINTHSVAELHVPIPPLLEQKRIVDCLNELQTETQRLESIYQRKLDALDALKKSLLHQAFIGKL